MVLGTAAVSTKEWRRSRGTKDAYFLIVKPWILIPLGKQIPI